MKQIWTVLIVLALLLSACAQATQAPAVQPQTTQPQTTQAPTAAGQGEKVVLRALFMKQAGYQESDIEGITSEFKAKNPNIDIQTEYVTYEALHDKIVTAAASKAGTYDVILIDCIWPAEFAAAGFVKDVSDLVTPDMLKDIWPGAIQAVTYQNKLYA